MVSLSLFFWLFSKIKFDLLTFVQFWGYEIEQIVCHLNLISLNMYDALLCMHLNMLYFPSTVAF